MKKTVVVCGGSRGIGAATIRILITQGFRVVCISRTKGELVDLFTNNFDIEHLECDLTDHSSRHSVTSRLRLEKNIWGIINNSSGPATGPALDATSLDFTAAFEGHLFAANEFLKPLLPLMKINGGGRVVNIISVTARIPLENFCVSNTLRGAMLNWSKTLSRELGKMNITVNNVLPGYTLTKRLEDVLQNMSKNQHMSLEDYSQKILSQVPLGRFARPKEIASVIAFLLSEEAYFLSGASIPVDGGWSPCV